MAESGESGQSGERRESGRGDTGRLRPIAATGRPASVVRLRRPGSPIALSAVGQRFDAVRGEYAPTRFTRAVPWYHARRRTYRVVDVIEMWRVPLPWWDHGTAMAVVDNCDTEAGSHSVDGAAMAVASEGVPTSSMLLPVSRIVWRVTAQEFRPPSARRSIPALLCDLACDPDGRWLFLRAYY